jgi:signal peptidase II
MAVAWGRAAAVALVVLAADQATKAWATSAVQRGDRDAVLPGIDLVNVRNDGIAFGLLDGHGGALTVVTLVALALLVAHFALRSTRPLLWLATGLLVGGALGNLVDRARQGSVTDFVDLPLWPAFNLADVAIVVGVLTLLASLEGAGARGAQD